MPAERGVTFITGRSDEIGADGRHVATSPDADWAIVILAEPLGTADRILPILRRVPPAGTKLALAGYEQDRLHVMVADLACPLRGIARDAEGHAMLTHTCVATRGASGGPLLAQLPDGRWHVIGIA